MVKGGFTAESFSVKSLWRDAFISVTSEDVDEEDNDEEDGGQEDYIICILLFNISFL